MFKVKSFLKFAVMAGVIFGICFALGAGITRIAMTDRPVADNPGESEVEELHGDRVNILALGVDARPGEDHSRSDTMILASIDPELKKVALISIPRDTKVDMPGSPFQKICIANYMGGPDLAVEKVEELLGEKVDYYVEMDFNGFEEIVDTLGGVSIDVPQRMYKPMEGIDLQPGLQELSGKDALAFVRYRDYIFGDIDRTSQQQVFIKALAEEALKASTITKLPKLAMQMNKYVETNIGVTDMVKMASWAKFFSPDAIIAQTLPGYFYDEVDSDGNLMQSYWQADASQVDGLIDRMIAGDAIPTLASKKYSSTVVKTNDDGDGEEVASADNSENAEDKKEGKEPQPSDDEEYNWERSRLESPGHELSLIDMN